MVGGASLALPALVPAAGSADGPGEGSEPVPAEVVLAFHPGTLAQVLFARARLRLDDPADRFLAASLVGILHGKRPGYLSELMPNAFSMAPRYARDYAARTGFAAPERDLFVLLAAKLRRLARDGRPRTPGIALLGDARDAGIRARAALRNRALPDRARLVLTSPPYLRVLKYGYYNWLRTWFLGFSADAIDATLDDAHRREPYLAFLREVLAGLRPALADDAVVALVLGDVEAERGRRAADGLPIGLAAEAWEGRGSTRGLPAGGDRGRRGGSLQEDDEAVGRRGGAGHPPRPDPRPRAHGGRAAARDRRGRTPRGLELASPPLTWQPLPAPGRVASGPCGHLLRRPAPPVHSGP